MNIKSILIGIMIGVIGAFIYVNTNETIVMKWTQHSEKFEKYKDEYQKINSTKELLGTSIKKITLCEIYAEKPEHLDPFIEDVSVEDLIKLAVIGHETMHCFGYDHY